MNFESHEVVQEQIDLSYSTCIHLTEMQFASSRIKELEKCVKHIWLSVGVEYARGDGYIRIPASSINTLMLWQEEGVKKIFLKSKLQ